MRNDGIYSILWLAAMIFAGYLAIKYLWPIILIIILLVLAGMFKARRNTAKAEEEIRNYQKRTEQQAQDLQDQLFEAQVQKKRDEEAVVIDAEFEPVDRNKEQGVNHHRSNG